MSAKHHVTPGEEEDDVVVAPTGEGVATTALVRLKEVLDQGDYARALELADGLAPSMARDKAEAMARIWLGIGARRPLLSLAEQLGEGGLLEGTALAAELRSVLTHGLPMLPIPSGSFEELQARAAELGRLGQVRALAHCHLGLAGVAPRVDWRVGHLEHAAALAEQLEDPGLSSLVMAFEARMDAFLGEDDEARERVEATRQASADGSDTRAGAIVEVVAAILDRDRLAYDRAMAMAAAVGAPTLGFGLEWRDAAGAKD